MDGWGFLDGQWYMILVRDMKWCASFRRLISIGRSEFGFEPLRTYLATLGCWAGLRQ